MIEIVMANEKVESVYVIGGERLYREAIHHPRCGELIITHIQKVYESCDAFFPNISQQDWEISVVNSIETEGDVKYEKVVYRRQGLENASEYQYLGLLNRVLTSGVERTDRTGVGTLSVFGANMRFDIGRSLPLLTTKKVIFKSVCEEILWMLRGCTDVKKLREKGVHIWDANSTAEFQKKNGLSLEADDIGPTYGYLMRYFGLNDYTTCHEDYRGEGGVDQVVECLRLIREDPMSRRIIMTLWNPQEVRKASLPPCACFYQWYVADGKLSCSVYQRSGDLMLGVPFNMVSATLITVIFAKICGLELGELFHTIGDAHIYKNHIDGAKEQLNREPRPFPKLVVGREGNTYNKVEDFTYEDFKVLGYNPYPFIKLPMAE